MADLFKGIYEPTITIFLEAGEAMEAMSVVVLGTGSDEGKVFLARGSNGAGRPYGFVAQKVTQDGVAQYGVGGLITRTAAVGDKVGVYVGGGILKTDRLAAGSSIVGGDVLYAGASGTVTDVQGSETVPVGIAETSPDSDGVIRFKSLL